MARLLSLLVLVLFVGVAVVFAGSQSLWTDEVTQLSGVPLPFWAQLDWLAGGANPVPGVPPDRMPPLSYWIGHLWSSVFGLGEMQMRMLGVAALVLGAPALWFSARRLAGPGSSPWGAALALAAVYLSPGIISQAVEIRAYPIYLAFSLWATWAFVRALETPSTGRLAALLGFSLCAIYTHYFGLVMAGSLWFALLVAQILRRGAVRQVLVGGVLTLLLSAGIAPFLLSAVGMSGGGQDAAAGLADAVKDTVRLGFRLLFHATHLAYRPVTLLALAAIAGLVVLAIVTIIRAPKGAPVRNAPYLLVPLLLAFIVLPLLKTKIAGFDVLAPHYNLWMVPLVALFLATPFSVPQSSYLRRSGLGSAGQGATPVLGRIAAVFGVGLVAAHLWADGVLARYAPFYSHGPSDWVAEAIDAPGTPLDETLVIHDAEGPWAAAYFGLYYHTQGAVTQILRSPGEPDRQLLPGRPPEPVAADFADRFPRQVFLRTQSRSSAELAQLLRNPGDCGVAPMDTGAAPVQIQSRCAYYSATMSTVQR